MAFESGSWAYRQLPQNYTRKKKSKVRDKFLFFLITIVSSFLLNLLIQSHLIFPIKMGNSAMEPSLNKGSLAFFSYSNEKINRHDIVYVSSKVWQSTLICRIMGLPQEKIHIENGYVYINSEKLSNQNFLVSDEMNLPFEVFPRDNRAPEIIPQDHYFCLFDNRNLVNDSRSYGTFSKNEIVGSLYSKGMLSLNSKEE